MSDGSGLASTGLPKPLAELSDRELEEELQRRRRLRAAAKRPEPPITEADRAALLRFERAEGGGGGGGSSWAAAAAERVDLARHYAALELAPGASLAQVEAAYKAMVAKYSPDKHANDPERHRLATQLVQELSRSYRILVDRLR